MINSCRFWGIADSALLTNGMSLLGFANESGAIARALERNMPQPTLGNRRGDGACQRAAFVGPPRGSYCCCTAVRSARRKTVVRAACANPRRR